MAAKKKGKKNSKIIKSSKNKKTNIVKEIKVPGYVKISSFEKGKELCIFCNKPNTGHLVTEFDVQHQLKGLSISVCNKCQKERTTNLRTNFDFKL